MMKQSQGQLVSESIDNQQPNSVCVPFINGPVVLFWLFIIFCTSASILPVLLVVSYFIPHYSGLGIIDRVIQLVIDATGLVFGEQTICTKDRHLIVGQDEDRVVIPFNSIRGLQTHSFSIDGNLTIHYLNGVDKHVSMWVSDNKGVLQWIQTEIQRMGQPEKTR